MPSVTYDGRSFMIDGRRIWIVSASIPFNRIARARWEDRIHAAKLAGFNTIEVPVPWSRVEPRPGQFDFTGDNDVRHFIELVGKAQMWCILRPGPYIGDDWELGGIPAWIQSNPDCQLRAPNQPFLEACSRYIGALAQQLGELQVTSPGHGGPILLLQVESQWACSHEAQALAYLGELNRYFRESGFTIPTVNANNLWQGVESEIDCWVGEQDMLSTMRQLGAVLPDQPRLVIDFGPKAPARIGEPAPAPVDPAVVQRELAQVLAGGGQFNYVPFAAGGMPGFHGGQLHTGQARFLAPINDLHAPIDLLGRATPRYHAIRTLSTFASQFAKVFAHIDSNTHPIVLDPSFPGESKPSKADFGPVIVHRRGSQGSLVFIFSDPHRGSSRTRGSLTLLLGDGSSLPVELCGGLVHWCVFDVHLSGRCVLTYSSLCVLGFTGKTLVVFGGAGTLGQLAINGSPLEVEVPTGRHPLVIEHEGVHVVVCSEAQIATTFIASDAVYVGVDSLDAAGEPIASGKFTRISAQGEVTTHTRSAKKAPPSKINIEPWEAAPARDHADGSNPRYATIPAPATLAELGALHGYGWYRIQIKLSSGKRAKIMAPACEDRFQLLIDGAPAGVLGTGPGADQQLSISLRKGDRTLVVLADNMGHVCDGSNFEWRKGLCHGLFEVAQVKTGRPKVIEGFPLSPLNFRSPLFGVREDDQTHPHRICWTVQHRRKTPLFVVIDNCPARGLLVINNEPMRYLDEGESATVTLEPDALKRGNNVIEFAVVHEFGDEDEAIERISAAADAFGSALNIWEGKSELTAKGTWAFAKWERPMDSLFEPTTTLGDWNGPTWWRTTFHRADPAESVTLTLSGMTKGHVFVNGQSVSRYFVAGPDGKPVPPVDSIVLDASLLQDGENELVLFDEHGGSPAKCKLTAERAGEAIRAIL